MKENEDIVRSRTKKIAGEFIEGGDPVGWFDEVYSLADGNNEEIPWADLEPNRFLVEWAHENNLRGDGKSALVVGCGLGDDAKFLDEQGFLVTAFDVSPKAVEWAKNIFAKTLINFYTVDLFSPPRGWKRRFDFVLEVYTVQALPLNLREKSINAICDFVAVDGELLVVSHVRDGGDETIDGPPWALSKEELEVIEKNGFEKLGMKEMFGDEEDPVKRIAALYKKSNLK